MSQTTYVPFEQALKVYEPVFGLETHVELGTKSKMWCGCSTDFGADANTQVCPVCLGLPGSMPVVNRVAVESTIRIGLALNCSIATWCRFARKNYFYPDMPKDYQISQYDEPLCFDGYLDVTVETPEGPQVVRVEIERVHMEEDTGKLTHAGGATGRIHGADYSLVDYNRAGIPLIEIVTKPVSGTGALAPAVARAYVSELRDVMRALGVSDVRMEEGSLRCDVNLSLNRPGEQWGTRSETKKPDLVPGAPSDAWVEQLRSTMPEMPSVKRARLQAEWNINEFELASLVNAGALDLVEATIAAGVDSVAARKWWTGELLRVANDTGVELADLQVSPGQIREIEELIALGALNDKLARQVFEGIIHGEGDVASVIAARGLAVVSDDTALLAAIDQALSAQPDVADKIRSGKVQAAGAIVGAVMKSTKGQADAAKVRILLLERLGVSE